MRSRSYKTEGIIIKRLNLGEADRILTVFTKFYGKLSCIAKGVRKPTSRKSGHIELFDRTTLFLAKGKNLDIVTQAEVVERFANVRNKLKATKAAYHTIELIDLLIPEGQENEKIYKTLIDLLRTINKQRKATVAQIANYEAEILKELGFGVPKVKTHQHLQKYIESIVEKHLNTVQVFRDV